MTLATTTRLSGVAVNPSRCLVLNPPASVVRWVQNEYTDIQHGAYGLPSRCSTGGYVAPSGYRVKRLFGRAGTALDAIGIVAQTQP